MLIDRPQIVEGSAIQNASIAMGTAFPSLPNAGELFYLTSGVVGLYVYNGGSWDFFANSTDLATHKADDTRHLTAAQNTLLDNVSVSAADLNSIPTVSGRVSAVESSLSSHISDDARHLTSTQNTFLDGLNLPSLTPAHLNFVAGATSNIQAQLNSVISINTQQTSDIAALQSSSSGGQSTIASDLTAHKLDDTRHLTASQNTFLDGISIDFTQINKLSGLVAYLGSYSLSTKLASFDNLKLNVDGSNNMTAPLNMSGFKLINAGTPTLPSDVATKDYVDSFVQGLHWVGSARVATIQNITLSGQQTIDGVALNVGDRVLVKNQTTTTQNGIWLVSTGSWTRANDYNDVNEVNNSAAFVLEGTSQGRSTWVQLTTIAAIGTDPIVFSAFSGPVVNSAGPGITLGAGGMVSVVEGAGLTFSGNSLIADVHASGGIIATVDNATTSTSASAQLALSNVGTAGTYRSVTTDGKGRVISGTNPTTLSAYGITDAVNKAGDTITTLAASTGLTLAGSTVWTQNSLKNVSQLTNDAGYLTAGGSAGSSTLAAKASTLAQGGGNGTAMTFNWSGQTGQPSWLWGGTNGIDMYVYNPSNFSVSYAASAGTAANATNATNATNAANATSLSGFTITGRSALDFNSAMYRNTGFYSADQQPPNAPFAYSSLITAANADVGLQIAGGYNSDNLYFRSWYSGGANYLPWRSIIHNGNIASQSVANATNAVYAASAGNANTATNATNAGYATNAGLASNTSSIANATGIGYTWTGVQQFMANKGNNVYGQDATSFNQFFSNDLGAAGFSFHRGGAYAVNMTLDPDNCIRIGGWSMPGSRFSMDAGGNLVMAGNITAYSDIRLKTDIAVIPNALEKVLKLRGVTYTRAEDGSRNTGVIAQEVQEVLPEAVATDKDGMLSVAYGNLVGLLIESIKELKQEVKELRQQIEQK